jgi:glycerol-3-phosphate O-acyltransferase
MPSVDAIVAAKVAVLDEVSQAVLAREEVVRYLRGGYGGGRSARARTRPRLPRRASHDSALRICGRCSIRSARFTEAEKVPEQQHYALSATRDHRVVYASNHKSHLDYLVEPIVLDDAGVRPPLIAAGINLFGGPLGLIHKHITGAIPIRRNTKDPAYLITLKAYVAEILKKHDLFLYPEGGRGYSWRVEDRERA